jgi:hypothetical protein
MDWFKPEDFNTHNIFNVITGNITISREDAAALANARVRKVLENAPIVHGTENTEQNWLYWCVDKNCHHVKSARLVDIRRLSD